MKIRFVKPEEWGTLEGAVKDMPWLVAKERFIGFFSDAQIGSGLYEHVEEKHGCHASNAVAWAVGLNSVISILNTIPDGASDGEVVMAFSLSDQARHTVLLGRPTREGKGVGPIIQALRKNLFSK